MTSTDVDMSGMTSANEDVVTVALLCPATSTRRKPMCAKCQVEEAVSRRRASNGIRAMTPAKEESLRKCQQAKRAMLDYQNIEKKLGMLRIKQLTTGLEPSEHAEKQQMETRALELIPVLEEIRLRKAERAAKRKQTMQRLTIITESTSTQDASGGIDADVEDSHISTDLEAMELKDFARSEADEDPELEAMFKTLREEDAGKTLDLDKPSSPVKTDKKVLTAKRTLPPNGTPSAMSTAGTRLKRNRAEYEAQRRRSQVEQPTKKTRIVVPRVL